MLIALGVSHKDSFSASNLLKWITELGDDLSKHKLLIVCSRLVDPNDILPYSPFANTNVYHLQDGDMKANPGERVTIGWPFAPNHMFQRTCQHVKSSYKEPFLWLEPDCVPLCSGWVDKIEEEYKACGHLFMGDLCTALPDVAEYMSGVGVYPHNAMELAPIAWAEKAAWDIVCGAEGRILQHVHWSKTIQHVWKDEILRVPTWFDDRGGIKLREGAVLFHRNKDGSLIEHLRRERGLNCELLESYKRAEEVFQKDAIQPKIKKRRARRKKNGIQLQAQESKHGSSEGGIPVQAT